MKGTSEDNLIVKLSFEFALKTIAYCEIFESQKRFVIANQLLKSGKSIGANIREAKTRKAKQISYINLKLPRRK